MPELRFPSAAFPDGPRVAFDAPAPWEPLHVPGAALALIRPAPEGVFNPNVVVTLAPQAAGFELSDALDTLDETARQRTRGATSEPYEADITGYRFIGRNLSWVDDDAGTVLQLHLFGSVPRPDANAGADAKSGGQSVDAVDLVHVTGTVGAAEAVHDYAQVRDLIATMTVAPWSEDADAAAASESGSPS